MNVCMILLDRTPFPFPLVNKKNIHFTKIHRLLLKAVALLGVSCEGWVYTIAVILKQTLHTIRDNTFPIQHIPPLSIFMASRTQVLLVDNQPPERQTNKDKETKRQRDKETKRQRDK